MLISRDGFRRPNTLARVSLQSEPFCTVFQEANCESVDAPLTRAAEPPIETTYLLLTWILSRQAVSPLSFGCSSVETHCQRRHFRVQEGLSSS